MSVRRLEKGDEVWEVQVERWNDLLASPRVMHGRVTGGREIRVIITWDGHDPERYSRHQIERDVYATKREALQAGKRRLEVIRQRASERVNAATDALAVILELLEEVADLLPCGCPRDLPEVHQEGCIYTPAALAERQLERSLDEQA